jgi:hypothetical protein
MAALKAPPGRRSGVPTEVLMDIVDQILDFFRRLVKSRVDGVQMQAKTKMLNTQAKAKAKVANSFNKAVDGGVAKAKGAATGKPAPAKPAPAKPAPAKPAPAKPAAKGQSK